MDRQDKLISETNNNNNNTADSGGFKSHTHCGISKSKVNSIKFWRILSEFYLDNSDGGISAEHLREKYPMQIHYNTILDIIKDLRNAGLIALKWHNVGLTHRRKLYKITEKGVEFWENNKP